MSRVCHRLCGYDRNDNRKYSLHLTPDLWEVVKIFVEGKDCDEELEHELHSHEANALAEVLEISEIKSHWTYFIETYFPAKMRQRA